MFRSMVRMDSRSWLLWLPLTLGLCPSRGVWGQAAPPDSGPARRWEISLTWGRSVGPGMWNLEHGLEDNGFGDDGPCVPFIYCLTQPRHHFGGGAWRAAVGYAMHRRVRVRLQVLWADLGTAEGFHSPNEWLVLHPTMRTLAVSVVRGDQVRLGVGPAVHVLDVAQSDGPGEPWRRGSRRVRPGVLLSGAFVTATETRVFGTGSLEAVLAPSATVGPFVARDNLGGSATMPPHRMALSYVTTRLGVGLRF